MATHLLQRLLGAGRAVAQALRRRLLATTRPAAAPLLTGAVADLARTKPELLAENALLRQQLLILQRRAKRPRCTPADRALLVLLASRLRTWRQALLLVQPDTLLRWHRLFWLLSSSAPFLGTQGAICQGYRRGRGA